MYSVYYRDLKMCHLFLLKVNKIIILIVSLVSVSLSFSHEFGTRVIGGNEAPMGYAGYHASLQNLTGHHVCGGAVISRDFIVTAAHCLIGAGPEYVKVVVGTSHLDHGGIEYEVKSIEIHEGYNTETKVHDIALVQLKTKLNVEGMIQIIDLYDDELKEGDDIVLTGFGALEANGESSRQMHILYLQVFNQETCIFAMRYTREVFGSMFCTFSRIGEGTCHGDSGGPLVINGKLAGLVSWGIPCAVGFPDVHTRIKPYNDWIRKTAII